MLLNFQGRKCYQSCAAAVVTAYALFNQGGQFWEALIVGCSCGFVAVVVQ